jgi:hypothetical protein
LAVSEEAKVEVMLDFFENIMAMPPVRYPAPWLVSHVHSFHEGWGVVDDQGSPSRQSAGVGRVLDELSPSGMASNMAWFDVGFWLVLAPQCKEFPLS